MVVSKGKRAIALDGDAHRALGPTLAALNLHHNIDIGLVVVRNGKIEFVNYPGNPMRGQRVNRRADRRLPRGSSKQ